MNVPIGQAAQHSPHRKVQDRKEEDRELEDCPVGILGRKWDNRVEGVTGSVPPLSVR